MATRSRASYSGKKRWIIIISALLLALAAFFILESTDKTNLVLDKLKAPSSSEEAKTSSDRETAQANFNDGAPKKSQQSVDVNRGGAVDNNQPVSTPPSSQQVSSSTGVITLFSPAKDAKIGNGSTISGKSSVNPVYFRLVDNTVGVIAQGPLSVTNGLFSGTLQINPKGTGGTLELYTTDSTTGRESNHLQIDVRF